MNTKEHHCEYRPAHTAEECPENTQQPQTIEEIVEEFKEKFGGYKLSFRREGVEYEANTTSIENWLTRTLTTLQTQHQQELEKAVRETEKAFGGCTKCYGKGYSTEQQGRVGNSRVTLRGPEIVMNYCSCERGKQLKALTPPNK